MSSKMTAEQQEVFDAAMAGDSFFLTGNAGTGKSFVLKQIIKKFHDEDHQFYVTASTGIAAVNVHGSTIHSLLQITPAMDLTKPLDDQHKRRAKDLFSRDSSTLIVDEISMAGVDLFTYLMKMVSYAESVNRFRMQLIFVGDFSQLPPVYKDKEKRIISDIYGGIFAFKSSEWTDDRFKTFMLTKIIRQDNPDFMAALNEIRIGDPQGINYINENCAKKPQKGAISLTATNYEASQINLNRLSQLKGPTFKIKSDYSPHFLKSAMPTDETLTLKLGARVMVIANTVDAYNGEMGTIEEIDLNGLTYTKDDNLFGSFDRFKYGLVEDSAKRAFAKTHDESIIPKTQIVSELMQIKNKKVFEKQDRQSIEVDPDEDDISIGIRSDEDDSGLKFFSWHEWKTYRYEKKNDKVKKVSTGKFKQLPFKLSYAITIHKSQGQTFNACNLSPRVFADGQLYVALSRVTDVSRLYLFKPLIPQMVRASDQVKQFYRHLLAKDGIGSLGVDPVVKKVVNDKKEIDGNLDVKPGRMLLLNWMNNLSDEQFNIARSLLRNALLVNDSKTDTADLIMQMISNARKLNK